MKQTAVELLAENIMPMIPFHTLEYRNNFIKFIEQATQMEEEQIIKAYIKGFCNKDITAVCNEDIRAKQYYYETFKSE